MVTIGYSVLITSFRVFNMTHTYLNLSDNPLMPKHLLNYIAFPLAILIPFFVIIAFLSYREIKTKSLNKNVVLICFILALLHFLFKIRIELLIQSFNPYGG